MFGRHGTAWQVTVAIVGLAIVGVVLIGPRMRERSTMVTSPTAIVANNADRVSVAPAAEQAPPPADPAAPAPADPSAPNPDPAAPRPGAGLKSAGDAVKATTSGLPSVPAISAVTNTATSTLFADNFESDPLTRALPTGWRLLDASQTSSGGGLPLVGGLLSGLLGGGGATSSVTSLLPTSLLDGTHVLGRSGGSWSHLVADTSGGTSWANYTASVDVKPLSGSGFVGVGGRFVDSSNFVSCGIQNGSALELLQVVDGQTRVLASQPLAAVPNVFHTVQMTMNGSQLSCSMDGQLSLNGVTSTLTSGPLGLVALGSLSSEFDNVRAIALP